MLGIFLDQETTGLDSYRHRVLEIALKLVDLSTGAELAAFQAIVNQPEEVFKASDAKALEVNGFKFDELKGQMSEKEVAEVITDLFQKYKIVRGKAVFICQNPSFDRAFFSQLIASYEQEKMQWPYHWLDLASMYWALEVQKTLGFDRDLPDEIWLSKDYIAKTVGLAPEEHPHRAMQGVDHLLACYRQVVGFSAG